MRIIVLLLIAASAFAQAISNPSSPSSNPNQINVTNSYLYLNKMHYAGTWSGSATYNSQDVVLYSSAAYISLQPGNVNNVPSGLGLWWVVLPGSGGGAVWGGIIGTLGSQTDLAAALTAKETAITAGTTAQYWRGDKTWQNFAAGVWAQLSGTTPISFNVLTGAISCPGCVTSNPVTSVFGRTAGVVAASGDYTAAQITNAVDSTGSYSNPSWITGLAWSKISGAPAFPANTGAVSHQFLSAYNSTTGVFLAAQPAFTDISGVPSFAANTTLVIHQFFTAYNSTTGVFSTGQPAFTDISGSLGHGQLPALLPGDIPNNAANTAGNANTATALAALPTPCTAQAATGILANGNSTGCFTPVITDSSPTRYWTATHWPSNGDVMSGAGWVTNMSCCSPASMNGTGGGLPGWDGMLLGSGGPYYAQINVRVPTGWTGAVTIGSFWTLQTGGTTGTGSHSYAIGCFVPGTGGLSTAITFSAATTVSWTNGSGLSATTGQVDSVTPTVPTCASGNVMAIKMTRVASGTDTDGTVLAYLDVALPHTVQ